MGDSTTLLFVLPGVRVQSVVRVGPGQVVHLVTDDPAAAACPVCGVQSTSVRQRRTTRPRDIAYGLESLAARWHKVQFACKESACPRKAFTEAVAQVPARARVTGRARQAAGRAVAAGASVAAAVRAHGMSWPHQMKVVTDDRCVRHRLAGCCSVGGAGAGGDDLDVVFPVLALLIEPADDRFEGTNQLNAVADIAATVGAHAAQLL
jgi:transposase